MNNYFEQIPHTADVKLRVYGETKQKLFIHALEGMFWVLEPISINCSEPITREVELHSVDEVSLLVDFLSEALCLSDIYNEAYNTGYIHVLNPTSIKATLVGFPIQGFEGSEIKAVTYNELVIEHTQQGWQVDIVFDI